MKLPVLVLVLAFIFLPCFNSYADDAEDLVRAAWKGDLSAVQDLLSKGVNVNAAVTNGSTALSLAKEKKYSEVVQALTRAGAKK